MEAPSVRSLTVMAQREVGERLAAASGLEDLRTDQCAARVPRDRPGRRAASRVTRSIPMPDVDSVLVRIERHETPDVDCSSRSDASCVRRSRSGGRRCETRSPIADTGSCGDDSKARCVADAACRGRGPRRIRRADQSARVVMRVPSYAKVNLWLRVVGEAPRRLPRHRNVLPHGLAARRGERGAADELTIAWKASSHGARCCRSPRRTSLSKPRVSMQERTDRRARISGSSRTSRSAPALAGGSGNAAAVLTGLCQLWDVDVDHDELMDDGRVGRVGSDVPFMLEAGQPSGAGRGEILERLPDAPSFWFVLGISHEGLSTGEVYGRWRPEHSGGSELGAFRDDPGLGRPRWRSRRAVRNDLEAAALELRPELADTDASDDWCRGRSERSSAAPAPRSSVSPGIESTPVR